EAREIHRAGSLLPGGSRCRAQEEQGQGVGPERADRNLAASDPYARIRQPGDQRAALPATGGAWLSGKRYGTGGLGTFDEERVDHRGRQESAAQKAGGTSAGSAADARTGRDAGTLLYGDGMTNDFVFPTYFVSHGGGPWPFMKEQVGNTFD